MKSTNFKSWGVLTLLLCSITLQSAFADISLKKDNPGPGGVPNITNSLKTTSLRTMSILPVSADVINDELVVDFSSAVGNATISVVDQYGSIIYLSTINTYSSSELAIPVTGWGSGSYTLKISYGTTNLIGSFQL